MKNRITYITHIFCVLVYGYLIYPSIKWLFLLSPEQKEVFVGGDARSITYISAGILVAGLLAVTTLVAQLFEKIEVSTSSDWGIKVLMINVGIEILTFLALYISISLHLISPEASVDTLSSVAHYNMYFNMILQVVATLLIVSGGVRALKKVK